MKNTFDRARAAENTSQEAITYLDRASQMDARSVSMQGADLT
ncbi:TPA: integrase, partial [Klebsiella pneumoniae]|nr:integrase [Klebsiella pneumoniae]